MEKLYRLSLKNVYITQVLFVIFLLSVIISCAKQEKSTEKILARVEDRVITVKDFRERSELTLRPAYCAGKKAEHKNIILNTLIAEKLLAIEGAKDSVLINNPSFKNYVLGVKEQAMRSALVKEDLEEELKISNEEKIAAYNQAIKKLKVAYVFSNKKEEIDDWKAKIDLSGFDAIEAKVNAGKSPHRKEVIWGENLPSLENALFKDDVEIGSIVGPVQTKVGYYILKVTDITKEVILGQGSLDTKLSQIEKVLFERKWQKATAGYVYNLMKDKNIKLDEKGFSLLVDYYKPTFAAPENEQELVETDTTESEEKSLEARKTLQNNLDKPLLTIDDQPWSIGDFIENARRRPLMLSSRKAQESEFPEYLKLAIKDLLTDKYLTESAYDKNFQDDPVVKREEEMWQDFLLATGKRALLLQQLGFSGKMKDNYFDAINLLRPQLNLIAKKYDVEINEAELAKTPLTEIQWVAIRQGVPYQEVVPELPVITNDERLDYLTQKEAIVKN